MIEFKIENGTLYLDGQPVRLPFPVAEGFGVAGGVAVRLDIPTGQSFNRNVFLLEGTGAVRWQIQESPHGTEDDKPFMNVWLAENGSLVAGNWNGVDYGDALAQTARLWPHDNDTGGFYVALLRRCEADA